MELVKSDLASVSKISSVEVGMKMLEAVMASIRLQQREEFVCRRENAGNMLNVFS
jgi:hypothetical protein